MSFLPHLVAGPIMRPTTLLPQIVAPRIRRYEQVLRGHSPDLLGLLTKKVVRGRQPGAYRRTDLFKWQTIHGGSRHNDGASMRSRFRSTATSPGYTDIARGIAKCMGFELVLNFNLPYFSTSPKEFWTRWHISLSTWLRNYLYIPLGGNRGGEHS